MYNEALKELEYISKAVGIPVAYTQGGGGNTSVKLDGELMAVKASGFKLKQVTPREGYVVVNYKNIRDFYENADEGKELDYEKESAEVVRGSVVGMEGLPVLRPSVEAGFHSILGRYVIHTHSVYANILCCSREGRKTVEEVFKDKKHAVAWIPYVNPGFCLTMEISAAVKASLAACGKSPRVFFMENHGLIVTDDDAKRCAALHEEVNERIRGYLGIRDAFPAVGILKADEGVYIGRTKYISDFFRENKPGPGYFDEIALYPDQLVYLNGSIPDKKLDIRTDTGGIVYKASLSEAQTMEETLLAYVYVLNGIKGCGLTVKTMTDKDKAFISGWESEAYRKSLVKA